MARRPRVVLPRAPLLLTLAALAAHGAPATAQDVASLPAMTSPARLEELGGASPEACAMRARALDLRGRLSPTRRRHWVEECIGALPSHHAARGASRPPRSRAPTPSTPGR